MTSELVSRITIRLHVFPFLVKVGRKVRKISSSLQYYEVEISFQVTIFLSSFDMSPNDDNFFIRAKYLECRSNRSILFISCIRARFSDENPSFSVSFCDPEFFLLIEKQKKIHYASDDGCFEASQILRRLSFLRVSVF